MEKREERPKGSVILLDVENLIIQARRDESCNRSDVEVLNIAISQALAAAAKFGPVLRADAAISVGKSQANNEKSDAKKRRAVVRKDNSRMMQYLIDRDFSSVTLVPQGKDAADWELYNRGMVATNDPCVQGAVLCTGDGGEPFLKLVQELMSAGKSVHVVSYDKIPRSLKNLNLPSSLLVSSVRLASIALEEKDSGTEEPILLLPPCETLEAEMEAGGALALRASAIKKAPSFRLVIRAIRECHADTNSDTYKKLNSAIWFFARNMPRLIAEERAKRILGRDPELLSQKYLIEVLHKGLEKELSLEEAKEIIFALCEYTDFFEAINKFRLNLSSDLLKQVKPF